jgi:uncharacterized protein DUF2610
MKIFKTRCKIRGETGWFQVYIGRPAPGFHPLKYQAAWLREVKGGEIDAEVMEETENRNQ